MQKIWIRMSKCKFARQFFKTVWSGTDLQKTEMSYYQALNCNLGCCLQLHLKTKVSVLKEHQI